MAHRLERLDRDLRDQLAARIRLLKDPRLDGLVSVMRVEVSSDLSYAKVLIGSVHGLEAAKEACEALRGAAGKLRGEISRTLHIRKTPEFRFIPDDSAEYAEKIDRIIEGWKAND